MIQKLYGSKHILVISNQFLSEYLALMKEGATPFIVLKPLKTMKLYSPPPPPYAILCRVRAHLDLGGDGNPYENNEFIYSWSFTNQLTVNVYQK